MTYEKFCSTCEFWVCECDKIKHTPPDVGGSGRGFLAKKNSPCTSCGEWISPGQPITSHGGFWAHAACLTVEEF